jgi:hypothetical protein
VIKRIYVITHEGREYLVDANSPAAALRHVARRTMGVAVAKQSDLVRLLTAGVKVESAGEDDQQAALEFPEVQP